MRHTRLLLAAGTAALALGGTAHAADLIVSQPGYSIGTAPYSASSWEGLYFGGHVGYGWGMGDIINGSDFETAGFFAGVQAGYNFNVTTGVVAGVEADISWANISGEWAPDAPHTINWMGSLRGRVGFDAGAFMPYVTAGLAVAGTTKSVPPDEFAGTHLGWTAGAGVEVAMTDNSSVKLEYRYADFGQQDYNGTTTALNAHTIQAGLNWRF